MWHMVLHCACMHALLLVYLIKALTMVIDTLGSIYRSYIHVTKATVLLYTMKFCVSLNGIKCKCFNESFQGNRACFNSPFDSIQRIIIYDSRQIAFSPHNHP